MKRRSPSRRPPIRADLEGLSESLGYRFRDPALLDLALTHRSYAHEAGDSGVDNEVLEFLGDAILGFVVASHLYEESAGRAEVGDLSRRRADAVSEASLWPLARALNLGNFLRLGKGEEAGGGREKASLLADAFEAVTAAIYLDGGLDAARAFVLRRLGEAEGLKHPAAAADPKTRLQEVLQSRGIPAPKYQVVEAKGPDHRRSFTVEVIVDGAPAGRGEGLSKKTASTAAAREALKRLAAILRSKRGSSSPRRPGDDRD